MRRLGASLLTALLFLSTPAAATFNDCSCAADDNSCRTSISCPGGCIANCPSGGCYSSCKKGSSGEGGDDGDIAAILSMPITLQLRKGNSSQLGSELARITGKGFVFVPNKHGEAINLDVKDFIVWDVLEVLSRSGRVDVGGHDFSRLQVVRKALVSGERLSVCIHNASVKSVVEEYAGMSGLPVRVTSGDDTALVTLYAKGVTLEEILAQVSARTGVQIAFK